MSNLSNGFRQHTRASFTLMIYTFAVLAGDSRVCDSEFQKTLSSTSGQQTDRQTVTEAKVTASFLALFTYVGATSSQVYLPTRKKIVVFWIRTGLVNRNMTWFLESGNTDTKLRQPVRVRFVDSAGTASACIDGRPTDFSLCLDARACHFFCRRQTPPKP